MIDTRSPKPEWQRSSFCGTSTCVEVAPAGDAVQMRDGKNLDVAPLTFGKADWHAFLQRIAAGDYLTP